MITQFRDEYSWLSNFAPVQVELGGIVYSSVEHAYISAKIDDIEWKHLCASNEFTAGQLKRVSKNLDVIKNWYLIKYDVMQNLLNQKYNQEPYKTKLLNTENTYIQEGNYWNDTYWGVCLKTNIGDNVLGNLIMDIRKKLFESEK